jgi:hypothetical protein
MLPRPLFQPDTCLVLGDKPVGSTDPQRWARVPPVLAWKRPGLPTEWTRVLERNPEAMNPEPLAGCVWLDTSGKVLHDEVPRLEFQHDSAPSDGGEHQ